MNQLMDAPIKTPYDLPTLFYWLLSLARANSASRARQQSALRRYRDVFLRPSFWIRLGQKAGLLEPGRLLTPTLGAAAWLCRPVDRQWRSVLRAWQDLPRDPGRRAERAAILKQLAAGRPPVWHQKTGEELAGLRYLGLWDLTGLTPLGALVLGSGLRSLPEPQPIPWELQDAELRVQFPADWRLVWDLEALLPPYRPGCYLITPAWLRRAAQNGSRQQLIHILEQGTGAPLPAGIRGRILAQPAARLLNGPVLEFSSPTELAGLRAQPGLRRHLTHLLSPRAVLLDTPSQGALRALQRFGIPLGGAQDLAADDAPGAWLHPADLAVVAALLRVAQALRLPIAVTAGLAERIERALTPAAGRVSARLADQAVAAFFPPRSPPPSELPAAPEPAVLAALQEAILLEESVQVRYQAPGRAPEARQVSPLAVEQRGGRTYLLAYCHTRRGQRTFRLDRLQLCGSP